MNLFKVFIMSAVPVLEQRGAIPLGILYYNMNPALIFLVSFLGSLLPVPFILLLFNSIFKWMKKYKIFDSINNLIENKIRKNTGKIEKYKEIGLITFVAIPLPTTGLWTGSAVAAFLGLDFKKSLLCTTIGAIISAFLITILCIIFPTFFKYSI
ncbi:putative membrane protein [Clostridium tetanomorphum]|uniref:Small multi-drug export protein n=1 Tax=Clostridium tetanomorphum TaxID=1553 RepID=A0A923EAR4_CLOTT|nr:small multi-drug export protein [Clostridium tetanomorphum]KAJ53223.1 small multi-drug export protein [Clostridium tetanomorphum DSM 665]MBC2397529.1 small multi-drug export protein [Clostridium tetanomorphum]MBP1863625.1 putative membrane protein [Clostridium tetanomorphum]NRS86201.1 putative membrane protein [Clostridium tetanomorphum]NRZ95720.1 putative membrane protein [Clostridium tetanomorphum]